MVTGEDASVDASDAATEAGTDSGNPFGEQDGCAVPGFCAGPLGPAVFANCQQGTGMLSTDDASVYWTLSGGPSTTTCFHGGVRKCAKSGCGGAPTVLVDGGAFYNLVTASGMLYFGNEDLESCAVDGCDGGATTVLSSWHGNSLRTDGTSLFWATSAGVFSCIATACTPQALFAGWQVRDLVVDDVNAYIGVSGYGSPDAGQHDAVLVCPKTGCTNPSTLLLLPSGSVRALGIDSTTIYFGGIMGLGACAKSGCTTPTIIVSSLSANLSPVRILADGEHVYWSNQIDDEGTFIQSCPIVGCTTPNTIASNGQAFAIDDTTVYFSPLQIESQQVQGGGVIVDQEYDSIVSAPK